MNLLDDINKVIGSDSFSWIGRAVGDSPEMADRAASVSLPAILGGLSSFGSTPSGATQVINLVKGSRFDEPGALSQISTMGASPAATAGLLDQGKNMLGTLFGSKYDGLLGALSGNSGVKRSTIASMMSLLGPVTLAVIGRYIRDRRFDAAGLSSFFRDQHASLAGILPESIASMVGLGALAPHAYGKPVSEPIRREPRLATAPKQQRTWWPWAALALAGALGLLLFFMGRRHEPRAEVHRPAVTAPSVTPRLPPPHQQIPTPAPRLAEPTVPAPAPAPRPEQHATVEARTVDTSVHFANDSAALPAANPELDRVANAMRTSPNTHVRVTGYTDSNGSTGHNETLSRNRAEAVSAALVQRGVSRNRIDVDAEAETHPVATNATDQGRGANRRVELHLQNN